MTDILCKINKLLNILIFFVSKKHQITSTTKKTFFGLFFMKKILILLQTFWISHSSDKIMTFGVKLRFSDVTDLKKKLLLKFQIFTNFWNCDFLTSIYKCETKKSVFFLTVSFGPKKNPNFLSLNSTSVEFHIFIVKPRLVQLFDVRLLIFHLSPSRERTLARMPGFHDNRYKNRRPGSVMRTPDRNEIQLRSAPSDVRRNAKSSSAVAVREDFILFSWFLS